MAFDASPGGDPRGPWCKSCKQPIEAGQPSQRIEFTNDPEGKLADFNGLYHSACARPFLSFARVLNLNPWAR
jgi:hypothetical protein